MLSKLLSKEKTWHDRIDELVPVKLRVIWWVLRGRQVAYRLHVLGGIHIDNRTVPVLAVECFFEGGDAGIRLADLGGMVHLA